MRLRKRIFKLMDKFTPISALKLWANKPTESFLTSPYTTTYLYIVHNLFLPATIFLNFESSFTLLPHYRLRNAIFGRVTHPGAK